LLFLRSLASRQAVAGEGSHCGGLHCVQTPLRCSIRGRAAELTSCCALRSNSRGESVTKRAKARQPRICAPRRHRDRPRRPPPAAKPGVGRRTVARQHCFCKGVRGPPAMRL